MNSGALVYNAGPLWGVECHLRQRKSPRPLVKLDPKKKELQFNPPKKFPLKQSKTLAYLVVPKLRKDLYEYKQFKNN
jgi:hypothetical protein